MMLFDKDQTAHYMKTTPINPSPLAARGQIQRIQMEVYFSDVLPGAAMSAGTKFTFTFKDAFGHKYEIPYLMNGEEHAF